MDGHIAINICLTHAPQNSETGTIIFSNPFVAMLDEYSDGRWCAVEMGKFQSFHHFPVTSCKVSSFR